MKRLFTIFVLIAASLSAQEGAQVNVSSGPPQVAYAQLLFYDASGNLEYLCLARSEQEAYVYSISATTITNIVDSGTTATVTAPNHGLAVGNLVTIAGATVDTDLNGTYYVQTVADANTFTVTSANVTDDTYTDSGLTITTTAPRNTAAVWGIQKFTYSGTTLVASQWSGGKTALTSICANRATTTGATKVTYQ